MNFNLIIWYNITLDEIQKLNVNIFQQTYHFKYRTNFNLSDDFTYKLRTFVVNAIAVRPSLESTKKPFPVQDIGGIEILIGQLNLSYI